MSIEENNLRKDLEAAFEQHTEEPRQEETRGSAQDTPEPVRNTEAPQEAQGESAPDATGDGGKGEQSARGRDDKGRFAPGAEKPADGKLAAQPEGAPKANAEPSKPAEGTQPQAAAEPIAPPPGWKAGAREHWPKLPREVQEEVSRREKETAQTLRQSAQARQLANDFQSVVNPFLPMIQSQGSNPMAAVKNLMTTAAGLTVGTQVQKAQIVREIIQNYGIDIGTLDQVLAGQPVAQQGNAPQAGPQAPPPWAAPLFQFMNTVQQSRSQREQQMQAEADAEIAEFASKNEFFEDVREVMADLMTVAVQHGRILSKEDAYRQAVSLDPELSKVVSQREAAKRSTQQQSNIQRNRNAASSISGAPMGKAAGNGGAGDDSRRSAILEAWEAQGGR